MTYLIIAGYAALLFAALKLAGEYLPSLFGNKKVTGLFSRIFPVAELVLWITFLFWAAETAFGHLPFFSFIFAAIVVVIVAVLAWYLLRDFIAGIILRAENGFVPGERIDTASVSGTIKKRGYRSLEIITTKGEITKIPYTALTSVNISRPADITKRPQNSVTINFESSLSGESIKRAVRKRLLEMPWIVSEESITIQLSGEPKAITKGEPLLRQRTMHVWFHTITPETVIKTEEQLQQFLNSYLPME